MYYIYININFSHPNSPTASPKPPGAWLFQQGQENMADATVKARAQITEPVETKSVDGLRGTVWFSGTQYIPQPPMNQPLPLPNKLFKWVYHSSTRWLASAMRTSWKVEPPIHLAIIPSPHLQTHPWDYHSIWEPPTPSSTSSWFFSHRNGQERACGIPRSGPWGPCHEKLLNQLGSVFGPHPWFSSFTPLLPWQIQSQTCSFLDLKWTAKRMLTGRAR